MRLCGSHKNGHSKRRFRGGLFYVVACGAELRFYVYGFVEEFRGLLLLNTSQVLLDEV